MSAAEAAASAESYTSQELAIAYSMVTSTRTEKKQGPKAIAENENENESENEGAEGKLKKNGQLYSRKRS